MFDRFNRKIRYLRVSVTDRCNLRCRYCMPGEGIAKIDNGCILTFEEIAAIVEHGVRRGIDKVRITGGEPLVRKDIAVLVSMLADIGGIGDLAMTTNGALLKQFAQPLARAGLRRVNISLDAVDPDRYREITRQGDVRDVFRGIDTALAAGLAPVKLNCVVERSPDEKDARDVAEYAREKELQVRFIRRMDRPRGRFWPVAGGSGGKCESCDRLRLASDGRIFPCLFSDRVFDVRELGIREAFDRALESKPRSGGTCTDNSFNGIGG